MKASLSSSNVESITRDQLIFLSLFFFGNVMVESIVLIGKPLYPPEAERKGLSPSIYGAVLGTPGVTQTFAAFLCVYVERIGLHKIYFMSSLIDSLASILFGLLYYIDSYFWFVSLSFILMGFQGLANVGTACCIFALCCTVFPNRLGMALAIAETGKLVGLALGPLIASAISFHFGFTCSYVVFGFVQLGISFLILFCLPLIPKQKVENIEKDSKGYKEILLEPTIMLFIFGSFIGDMGLNFVNTILEPGLRSHRLNKLGVGFMFFCFGLFNFLGPVWGILLENIQRSELIVAFSFILIAISTIFLGPLHLFPITRTFVTTIFGLLIFGLGQGMLDVSTIVNFQLQVMDKGVSETESLSRTFVPVVYTISSGIGSMFGSSIGGILFENFGFPHALIFIFTTHLLTGALILLYMGFRQCRPRKAYTDETKPLLSLDIK